MFDENELEYFGYAGTTQYLGASGITIRCVQAMAAILTSAWRPEKITMISLRDHERHDHVMFVVWNWLDTPDFTIVPDGFGTHGGEGGAGLTSVLGLLKFYSIPLEHAITYDKKLFAEMAHEGKLSEQMFSLLKHASPYNWNYYPIGVVQRLRQGNTTFLEVGHRRFRIAGVWQHE